MPDANYSLDELSQLLLTLRQTVLEDADALLQSWQVSPEQHDSGVRNMACYVALRRHDLRELQRELTPLGLSSLGRLEGHVLDSLDAVLRALAALAGKHAREAVPPHVPAAFFAGDRLLRSRAIDLFGPPSGGTDVAIMVTLDSVNTGSPDVLEDLISRGATCFRINCAHDDVDTWQSLIDNVRRAESATGVRCPVLMDLAGPKVRIAAVANFLAVKRLHVGDQILLVEDETQVSPAVPLVQFTTTVPGLSTLLHEGQHLLIDDGKIDTVVEGASEGGSLLRIVRTGPKGARLKADRGLNIPDIELPLACLSPKDFSDLDFICRSAQMVGLSFVRQASDLELLQTTIQDMRPDTDRPGIVAKIETPAAFRALPEIIAAGIHAPFAVMIARGDLAVEAGFERLVEVQEEILWLCESAHVPVIWATQVLESLSHGAGLSRAEMTDAAMAGRAECVMLNKGPNLANAVESLSETLRRIAGHQRKKTAQLRALSAW